MDSSVFKDNGCAFLYISACTLGTGTVLEMHGMALLHLTGPQRSRLSLCSTAQTWEVQVETSFARGTLLLSGAFSKQVKCFKGSTQKQRAANSLVELQQGHPTRQRKGKLWYTEACSYPPPLPQWNWLCSSLPDSAFSGVTSVAWNNGYDGNIYTIDIG